MELLISGGKVLLAVLSFFAVMGTVCGLGEYLTHLGHPRRWKYAMRAFGFFQVLGLAVFAVIVFSYIPPLHSMAF